MVKLSTLSKIQIKIKLNQVLWLYNVESSLFFIFKCSKYQL